MKRSVSVSAAIALAMMICGCNPLVIDAVNTDSHSSDIIGDDDDDGGDEPEAAEPVSVLAMRWSQLTPFLGTGNMYEPGWIGPESSPDDLLVLFGSAAQTCGDPLLQSDESLPDVCDTVPFAQTILIIPADLAQPGTIDLSDPSVHIYHGYWLDLGDGGCGGGGFTKPGVPGTLEILSLDATSISVSLDGGTELAEMVPSGEYDAPVCP
jgi:hypothetical protein